MFWDWMLAYIFRPFNEAARQAPTRYRPPVAVPAIPATPATPGGVAIFRDINAVLDALPEYFKHLKELRKVDEDAFKIFSRIGINIANSDSEFSWNELPDDFFDAPPAIRALCRREHSYQRDGMDIVAGGIGYAIKMAGGSLVAARDGSIIKLPAGICYRLVMTWIDKNKIVSADTAFAHIATDGTITAVPEKSVKMQHLPRGRSRNNKQYRPTWIKHLRPGVPEWIAEVARCNRTDPETWFAGIVRLTMWAKRPTKVILVRCSEGDLTASWVIDRRDAKRFFRKRDDRARVLHYVRGHNRFTRNGFQFVREHYRGNRSFDWLGYHVEISGLGFHHDDFFDAGLDAYEWDTTDKAIAKQMISLRKMSRVLAKYYSRPVFLSGPHKRGRHRIDDFL